MRSLTIVTAVSCAIPRRLWSARELAHALGRLLDGIVDRCFEALESVPGVIDLCQIVQERRFLGSVLIRSPARTGTSVGAMTSQETPIETSCQYRV